jgi:hypothetical protein
MSSNQGIDNKTLLTNMLKNLEVGAVFSFIPPIRITFKDTNNNMVEPDHIVYLGENFEETQKIKNELNVDIQIYNYLVVLKNGDTIIWKTTESKILNELLMGYLKKMDKNVIPNELLQEIRLPKEKEAVSIVSEETPIQLPNTVKNELLVLLGQSSNRDYFPNEKEGGRKGKSKKSKRKSNKKRKTIKKRK